MDLFFKALILCGIMFGFVAWASYMAEKYPTKKPASHKDCERCKYEERIERSQTLM